MMLNKFDVDVMNGNHDFPKPKFEYFKHLRKLFTDYDYHGFYPYKPKPTTNGRPGLDNMAYSGYALTGV